MCMSESSLNHGVTASSGRSAGGSAYPPDVSGIVATEGKHVCISGWLDVLVLDVLVQLARLSVNHSGTGAGWWCIGHAVVVMNAVFPDVEPMARCHIVCR